MVNLIMSIGLMIFGLLMVVFCKTIAKLTSEFYYNLVHYHFSAKGYQVGFFIVGIIFIIFGILSLLGIIKYK